VSERGARLILGLIVAGLLVGALSVDLEELVQHRFWSDGATYYAMALSIAEDYDIRYEARDVLRVRREFGSGPEGIFLKRTSGGLAFTREFPYFRRIPPAEPRVYYAKAFVYSAVVAPLVRLLGGDGLLVANALFLGIALVCGYALVRTRASPAKALALALVVVLGSVTPVYVFWPQPELFNLALAALGLLCWSRERPLLAALVFGIATYSKPTHLFLALPLGVAPLLTRDFGRGLLESLRRGFVLLLTTASFWAVNGLVTGELNYQGGERKTFYERFPFETAGVTFGNSGIWMTTNRPGPAVVGDDSELRRGEGVPLAAEELQGAFVKNLGYFWYGRCAGAIAYYLPVVLAAAVFLARGPRDQAGFLSLAALVVSWVVYVWLIPANWYGGGGAVGNRYFVALVPLAFVFTPRGSEGFVAALGLAGSLVFVGPALASPIVHSLHPDRHTLRAPFRMLPAELTMLNDLSFNIAPHRRKIPFGDMGDLQKNWPADPKAYWLYFPDDGTFGKEASAAGEGVRMRPGQRAELILRAMEPVTRMTFTVSGSEPDTVTIDVGGREQSVEIDPAQPREVRFDTDPGFLYYDSFVHVIHVESRRAATTAPLLRIALQVARRPKPAR